MVVLSCFSRMKEGTMKTVWLWSTVILLALSGATITTAADPKDVVGDWEGELDVSVVKLTLIFHVTKTDDGDLNATMDSPDQGAYGLKVDSVILNGDELTFTMKDLLGSYEGTVGEEATSIIGTWTQAGKEHPLSLTRVKPGDLPKPPTVPKELAGIWEGTLSFNNNDLRIVVRTVTEKDKPLRAVLDSPDQGVNGIPITALELKDGTLTFKVKSIGGSFEGTANEDGSAYEGNWKQGPVSLPLTLKKTDKVTEARRPQHPKPPYPYEVEEVSYKNADAGITLAGTLTLPKGDGPFPAVLLITGSGPQDRDETIFGHKPFLVLADDLTRRGIAVLRVDDRGVGDSTGSLRTATSADLADDAEAGVAFLKAHPKIAPKRIGLVGHSEGGLIGPMVAARSEDVAFLVLLAGTGVNGGEIILNQIPALTRAEGIEEDVIQKQTQALRRIIEVLRASPDSDLETKTIDALVKELVGTSSDADQENVSPMIAGLLTERLKTPWYRYFVTYEPRTSLEKVHCPVLAINGEKDLQVDPKLNLPAIAQALATAGNERVTIREMPGLNHLFQPSKTGAASEYGRIEQTIAPEALEVIGEWIEAQTGLD